jgi:hypothetical protein
MNKRTAREIVVKNELLSNEQINAKIGTVENRDFPQTIYINISFWIKPKDNLSNIESERKMLEEKIKHIFNGTKEIINHNYFFPHEKENIYIYSIPENFNYNNKSNFISLEIYLHTINITEKKYPLNAKKNTDLFDECVKIANIIGNDLKKIENNFYVRKNSKSKVSIVPQ